MIRKAECGTRPLALRSPQKDKGAAEAHRPLTRSVCCVPLLNASERAFTAGWTAYIVWRSVRFIAAKNKNAGEILQWLKEGRTLQNFCFIL